MQHQYSICNPMADLQAPDPGELVALRMRHGLTQPIAGQLIGVQGKDWSRYECGARRMSVATWACLLLTMGEHPGLTVQRRIDPGAGMV